MNYNANQHHSAASTNETAAIINDHIMLDSDTGHQQLKPTRLAYNPYEQLEQSLISGNFKITKTKKLNILRMHGNDFDGKYKITILKSDYTKSKFSGIYVC